MAAPPFFTDGLGSFEGGVNSGIAPQLLENNQLAFATNVSLRGGFAHCRPGNKKQALNYGVSPENQPLVEQALFQGATYYKPDTGSEAICASIGGRLFQFTPDSAGNAAVRNISIPGDPNPANPQIAWLWQAENFVIVQDGQSVPIFYDGNASRRSQIDSVSLGTLAANFTVPAVNETTTITLTSAYTGQNNQVFTINGASYQATTPAATNNVQLKNLFDTQGTTHNVGTNVIIDPNVFGVQAVTINFPNNGVTYGPGGIGIILNLTAPYTLGNGKKLILFGKVWHVVSHNNNFAFVQNDQTVTMPNSLPAGTVIYLSGTSFPTTVIGTLNASTTAPAIGATVDTVLKPSFTGTDGQMVFINGGQYTIKALAPPPPGTSLTIINLNDNPGDTVTAPQELMSVPELPIGRMGTYGKGRVWMALTDGFSFIGGDIVGGPSGTLTNNFRDSVLKVTENTYLAGGGAFRVPSAGGQITAMRFTATLDESLGQGPLQVFTPFNVFTCQSPVVRADWATITNPILTEALIGTGGVGQNSTQLSNGDIIFRSPDANIRSLILARRDFTELGGNTPISREMQRVVSLENTSLLPFASAGFFDNRMYMTAQPTASALGIYHQGIMALNFDPISSLKGKEPSIYDGLWTGLNILQVITGVFSGVERTFAFCLNAFSNHIELWELRAEGEGVNNFDNDIAPITWNFETAATFKKVKGKGTFDPIELMDGEIYLSDIKGAVNVEVWYRPEYSQCWIPWIEFGVCANNPNTGDPLQYASRLGLGTPSVDNCDPTNNRPFRIGNSFQFRFQITGSCTFRGALFKAKPADQTWYTVPICNPLCQIVTDAQTGECEPCKDQGDCLSFPLVFYNLNANKTYTNGALVFQVKCSDGTTVSYTVQPGTVNFTLPFPPGFSGVYPPLVLNCGGTLIVSTIPTGATQAQIDTIVVDMINQCAAAVAQAAAPCPTSTFTNETVFFDVSCPEGQNLTLSVQPPPWISVDSANNRLVGQAGSFSGTSVAAATITAQSALNAFAQQQITLGTLSCFNVCVSGFGDLGDNVYAVQGYAGGLITNNSGFSCGPEWDGTFPFFDDFHKTWGGQTSLSINVDGQCSCPQSLIFNGCVDGVGQWQLQIFGDGIIWDGTRQGGTPDGVYTKTGGFSPGPATLTIVKVGGITAPGSQSCGS